MVTGASTGMGASTARELVRRGFHVLADVRRDRDADAIRTAGIEPVILDITSSEQVAALAARVNHDSRTLHALVNNAGIQVNAPVEALPDGAVAVGIRGQPVRPCRRHPGAPARTPARQGPCDQYQLDRRQHRHADLRGIRRWKFAPSSPPTYAATTRRQPPNDPVP